MDINFKFDALMAKHGLNTSEFDRDLQKKIFTIDELYQSACDEVDEGADANRQDEMKRKLDGYDNQIVADIRVWIQKRDEEQNDLDKVQAEKDAEDKAKADAEAEALAIQQQAEAEARAKAEAEENRGQVGFFEF